MQAKWEGKAAAKLIGFTPEQVWPHLEDFCSLNKYLPSIDTCYKLDGVYGEPGLIRYCSSTVSSDGDEIIKWCHEKLVAIDRLERGLTYEVTENNIGFKSYFGTIRVFGAEQGCDIEWSFVADPIEGWTMEVLLTYVEYSVRTMAESIGKVLESAE